MGRQIPEAAVLVGGFGKKVAELGDALLEDHIRGLRRTDDGWVPLDNGKPIRRRQAEQLLDLGTGLRGIGGVDFGAVLPGFDHFHGTSPGCGVVFFPLILRLLGCRIL